MRDRHLAMHRDVTYNAETTAPMARPTRNNKNGTPAVGMRGIDDLTKEYLEVTGLIERMHRRYLDVIRTELNRMKVRDINAVQGMLLANIGQEEIVIRDLIERGYYQGSNVSYNIKKLAELGYLEQERTAHDKRSVSITLTDKAMQVVKAIRDLESRLAADLSDQELDAESLSKVSVTLRRLERTWADYIHYGRR